MRDSVPPTDPGNVPSRRAILRASVLALLAAAVVLVTVVLPAEYDVDLVGTGRLLGLVVLSDPTAGSVAVRSDGLIAQETDYRIDRRDFELEAGEFVEYKYRLEAGEAMVYSWTATGPVRSEMHSEPDGSRDDYAEFFEVIEASVEGNGSYVAPFPGDHGWYWLNEGDTGVTVTIYAAGFFGDSIEYPEGGEPILRYMTISPGESLPSP